MNVKIAKVLCDAVGAANLAPYGLNGDRPYSWSKFHEIDLTKYTMRRVLHLQELVQEREKTRGAKVVLKDIAMWLCALEKGADQAKPRSVEQFSSLVTEVLARTPGHRVYRRDDASGYWQALYANKVVYYPERTIHGDRSPPMCILSLLWDELGERGLSRVDFHAADILGMSPLESLARKNLLCETPDLRSAYLTDREKFDRIHDKIGMQFLATGKATDDLDGNSEGRENSWYYSRTQSITLDRGGDPARVVIDVFKESDKEDKSERRRQDETVDEYFWRRREFRLAKNESVSAEDEELDVEDTENDDDIDAEIAVTEEAAVIEVPINPMVATFDLRRHRRLRIHVAQLTEYKYDPYLGSKLVLPSDVRSLVSMLLEAKGGFNDIITGKGGGAVILCAGKPGTGKTLTAEVYAEVMARPLYSVQTSQLGTTPEELEDNLLKVFARSQRWDAILLLDEADVYVAARGTDLQQNAIVGVFLRVLEYYSGVLFMTTNRADLVDDAIASRCIAKITYDTPNPKDQWQIWRILSGVSGSPMDDAEIGKIVNANKQLSGRDVKNLLKLGKLVAKSKNRAIDASVIEFVKRFRPTE